jgi:hypothetical protein
MTNLIYNAFAIYLLTGLAGFAFCLAVTNGDGIREGLGSFGNTSLPVAMLWLMGTAMVMWPKLLHAYIRMRNKQDRIP